MMEERLKNYLLSKDFQKLTSNAEGIYVFYRASETDIMIISVMHALTGEEFTVDQYRNILTQIKSKFRGQGFLDIRLLSLVFTYSPERGRRFCMTEDGEDHWLIDLKSKHLLIYENQSSNFLELRTEIERLLESEEDTSGYSEQSNGFGDGEALDNDLSGTGSYSSFRWFTLMNIIIIVITIVTHLVIHYSGLFGGTKQLMAGGALSWFFIKEEGEYYRILTSMFMHADIEHLFNNMLVLLFVGNNLERVAGKIKYLIIYFGSGIIAGITSISYNMIKDDMKFSVGASGAVFGVVGAMLAIIIRNKGRIKHINSRQMILFVVFSLYGGFTSVGIDNAAHVGGFLAGLLLATLLYGRPKQLNEETV